MTTFLSGKRILLITTQFYGYERKIIQCLKAHGAALKVYYDDPISYTRIKFLKNWISQRTRAKVNRFYRRYIIKHTHQLEFDYIFVLKGSIMSEPFMETLRRQHPKALLIQYQWDSLTNFNYERFLKHFDLTFTFDNEDAARIPALRYMPTFALDEFFELSERRQKVKQSVDVSFVGSNHSDRLKTLRRLRLNLDKQKLIHKFYVYLPFVVGLTSAFITRRMKPSEMMWKSLSRRSYKNLLLRSRYVLDLPSPKQTGVSLRTYEALASGCGFITTSKTIADEPFYNEKYIFIVDPETLENSIPDILMQTNTNNHSLSFEEYSLSGWVKRIFSIVEKEHQKKLHQEKTI